jgi:tRNA pseudouridine55 synthase
LEVRQELDGVVVIDKPAGWTSHDVVARCRGIFGQKRAGHAGTLDPEATGVLLVGLGRATRALRWLSGLPKRYTGEVVLGVATSTLDSSGEVVRTWDMRGVTLEEARAAAAKLTGEISQVPPMVSALKVGGRRLHSLARAGVEVERQARRVKVQRFEVELGPGSPAPAAGHGPVLAIDVECSSGTYVRSLAADLGELLGGGAHLRNLRRSAVGRFTVEHAVTLEALGAADDPGSFVLPPAEALREMSRALAGADLARSVSSGRVLPVATLLEAGASGGGPWAVVSTAGELLAIYEPYQDGLAKPAAVFAR